VINRTHRRDYNAVAGQCSNGTNYEHRLHSTTAGELLAPEYTIRLDK